MESKGRIERQPQVAKPSEHLAAKPGEKTGVLSGAVIRKVREFEGPAGFEAWQESIRNAYNLSNRKDQSEIDKNVREIMSSSESVAEEEESSSSGVERKPSVASQAVQKRPVAPKIENIFSAISGEFKDVKELSNLLSEARNLYLDGKYVRPMTTSQQISNSFSQAKVSAYDSSVIGLAVQIEGKLEDKYKVKIDYQKLENYLFEAARYANQSRLDRPEVKEILSFIAFSLDINEEAAKEWLGKIQEEVRTKG